jgi:hypothetical protein
MPGKPVLEVKRMKYTALWQRLEDRALELETFGYVDMKSAQVRYIAREILEIGRELRMRGLQLDLPLGQDLRERQGVPRD